MLLPKKLLVKQLKHKWLRLDPEGSSVVLQVMEGP